MASTETRHRGRLSPWLTGTLAAAIVLVVAAASFYGGYRVGSGDGGSGYQERIVGAWQQGGSQGDVAFQFFPDGSVAVAQLSQEGGQVSFRGLYEIVDNDTLLLDLVDANPPEGEAPARQTRVFRIVSLGEAEMIVETESGLKQFQRMQRTVSQDQGSNQQGEER